MIHPTDRFIILGNILNFIYKVPKEKQWEKLKNIGQRNALTRVDGVKIFRYRAGIYAFSKDRAAYRSIPILHESFNEEMNEYLQENTAIELEEERAKTFLIELLLKLPDVAFITELLPDCLHASVGKYQKNSTIFSQEEVSAFHELHKDTIQAIKERLVLNWII